jgi:hypothetical protein
VKTQKQAAGLKSYITPWKSEVILACKRCQKKLRKQRQPPEFANLKKWVKTHSRKGKAKSAPHIIAVPCLKICPKGGIVVFSQSQLATSPARFSIISNGKQMEVLCTSGERARHGPEPGIHGHRGS